MNSEISVRYIGHATTLIEFCGSSLLTDPHFGRHAIVMPRRGELPIDAATLPTPTAVLLSHVHHDHLHISSYKYISTKVPIIVPEGCERAVGAYLSNPIIELSYYANYELADGTIVTAVPCEHRAGRVSQLRFTRTNAYLIHRENSPARVLFCGDSAYGPHFSQIGNLGGIDVALLPIGGYKPRWLSRRWSMTPAEAVQAFEDLRAKEMIPIHHGTFRLSFEHPDEPANLIAKIAAGSEDLKDRIHILKPGEIYFKR